MAHEFKMSLLYVSMYAIPVVLKKIDWMLQLRNNMQYGYISKQSLSEIIATEFFDTKGCHSAMVAIPQGIICVRKHTYQLQANNKGTNWAPFY